jgi:hypothetical protein
MLEHEAAFDKVPLRILIDQPDADNSIVGAFPAMQITA